MAIIKFTRVADKHESSLQQQQRAAQIGLASSQQGALALQAALTAVKLGDAAMDSRPLNAAIKGMGRLFGSEQSSEELAKEKRARALDAMGEQDGDSGATGTISDTYLVDDEEVDVIAVSDSVKGAHVTVMIWGMLRNKAERLAVESVKAVIRAVGGRRRGGH